MKNDVLQAALNKISAQQPAQRSAVWMVGEQLKDILRGEPHLAEIVLQDLEVKEMSIAHCEKKIKAYADDHKTGNFACVIPAEADRIIREFYGLAAGNDNPDRLRRHEQAECGSEVRASPCTGVARGSGLVDLADFF